MSNGMASAQVFTTEDYINNLYKSVLGRQAAFGTTGGASYWKDQLDKGEVERGDLERILKSSEEAKARAEYRDGNPNATEQTIDASVGIGGMKIKDDGTWDTQSSEWGKKYGDTATSEIYGKVSETGAAGDTYTPPYAADDDYVTLAGGTTVSNDPDADDTITRSDMQSMFDAWQAPNITVEGPDLSGITSQIQSQNQQFQDYIKAQDARQAAQQAKSMQIRRSADQAVNRKPTPMGIRSAQTPLQKTGGAGAGGLGILSRNNARFQNKTLNIR